MGGRGGGRRVRVGEANWIRAGDCKSVCGSTTFAVRRG
jgi:hypothetical protein